MDGQNFVRWVRSCVHLEKNYLLRCSIWFTWNLLFLCIIRFERVAMAQQRWDLQISYFVWLKVLKVWAHVPSFGLIYIYMWSVRNGEKCKHAAASIRLMFSLSNRRSNKSRALGSCQKMSTWVEWVFLSFVSLRLCRNVRFLHMRISILKSIFKSKSSTSIEHWDDSNYTVLVEVIFLVKLNCIISMPAASVNHWFLFSQTFAEHE